MNERRTRRQVPEHDPWIQDHTKEELQPNSQRSIWFENFTEKREASLAEITRIRGIIEKEKNQVEKNVLDDMDGTLPKEDPERSIQIQRRIMAGLMNNQYYSTNIKALSKIESVSSKETLRVKMTEFLQACDNAIKKGTASAWLYYKDFLKQTLGTYFSPDEMLKIDFIKWLIEKIQEDTFSESFLVKIAQEIEAELKRETEKVKSRVEKVKKDLIRKIESLISRGKLPPVILQNLHRLDNVSVSIAERFNYPTSTISGTSVHLGVINVYSDELISIYDEELNVTIAHEMIHEISGLALKVKHPNDEKYDWQQHSKDTEVERYKIGLKTKTVNGGRWLNEAATVMLNNMLGYEDKSYNSFTSALQELLDYGLDPNLVWEAYFENIAIETGANESINFANSAYRKLIDKINEIQYDKTGDKYGYTTLCNQLNPLNI